MWRRIKVLLVVAVVGTAAWATYSAFVPTVSAGEFHDEVERAIPPGTPRTEAAEWLRTQGYIDNDLTPGCCSFGDSCHTREFSVSRWPRLFPKWVRFEIAFDEQGRRTGQLDVQEVGVP